MTGFRRAGLGVATTMCALLLAGVLLVASAPHGLGVSPDSVSYLHAAEDLGAAQWPTDAHGDRFVAWPPLYPALVALTAQLTGQDALAAARTVQAVLLVILVIVFAGTVRRVVALPSLQVVGVLVVAFGPPVFQSVENALSELLFSVLVLASLWALAESRRAPASRALVVGAATLAAATALTRYVGVLVICVGAVSLLPRRRAAAGYVAVAGVPLAVWLIGNQVTTGTLTGQRTGAGASIDDTLRAVTETAGQWAAPGNTIPLVFGVVALAAIVTALLRTAPTRHRDHGEILPFWLFSATCPVLLVLLASLVAFDRVDRRLLAPVWAPVLIIALVAVGNLLGDRPESRRRRDVAIVYLGVGIWLVAAGIVLARDAGRLAHDGSGYASSRWDRSALMDATSALPAGVEVATNAPYALAFRTGRPPRAVDDIAPGFRLAWFDDPERPRDGKAPRRTPQAQLADEMDLELRLVQALDDGRLFRVVGRQPGG